ncbi:hypothetical protein [Ureibacillus sinduriensis]|uniref:Uncharacterized protein n=1 Tax=Ureibacillus sinduriensis BLB-1 = JCM 15800 TaxID=1384057 RepID=A0A0A3HN25_9BACL|nr:hypothetical protein [Ureibacillus sinduriensis]KGR73966.1 hypothetical protein CD33_18325 [Ureibacillus sinduriensis BLB-1 = JCM 15800]
MKKKRKKKRMKKWLRSILIVAFLLVAIVGGYALYEFKFKTYDVADEKVDEIIEDNYVIELPDGTELTLGRDGEIVKETSKQVVSNNEENVNSTETLSSKPNNISNNEDKTAISASTPKENKESNETSAETIESKKPTVKSIKEKYRPALEALQSQASSRINNLIGNAKSEYIEKKANGGSISPGYFYHKYMAAANSLEASTDAAFNSLIKIIENDLAKNGYDRSHAQSFRDEYAASKEELRSNLLSQVKSAL